ncbi:MAG: DUF3800 domain-containing protein [Hoeflea sp.]|uniref:DUF3800 domain-containing protein n=1 Tax=Hoeflea sp. TaxID=1940281 RepID=UPI0032EDCC15
MRRYIFSDEAGDFNFSRQPKASRYFILCTIAVNDCSIGHELIDLKRELIWNDQKVRGYFHAVDDLPPVRDAVYELLQGQDFTIQATIMEKSKAQPQVRSTKERFFQYGWLYHFRYALNRFVTAEDELQITAASIGTKKGQRAYSSAVNDVIQQHLPRDQWQTSFPPSAADPCLQITDYCTWALQRKWELGKTDKYDLIADKITYQRDMWAHGNRHYY